MTLRLSVADNHFVPPPAGAARLFLAVCCAAWLAGAGERPLVRFAVVADVQYADQPAQGRRDYRNSLSKLEQAVEAIQREQVDFVIQLGDLTDGGRENLLKILPVWNRFEAAKHHVLGNHDFFGARGEVLSLLKMKRAYYDFTVRGWRFVVLDGMDVSVGGGWAEGSAEAAAGRRMLEGLQAIRAENAVAWNGGLGERQLGWLQRTLARARDRREKVIVFCHLPLTPASSTPQHVLWNHGAVCELLEAGPVAACFSGHDHAGGYALRNGIHYVTVPAMVESGSENAWGVVEIYRERLEVRGAGTVPSRSMRLGR